MDSKLLIVFALTRVFIFLRENRKFTINPCPKFLIVAAQDGDNRMYVMYGFATR